MGIIRVTHCPFAVRHRRARAILVIAIADGRRSVVVTDPRHQIARVIGHGRDLVIRVRGRRNLIVGGVGVAHRPRFRRGLGLRPAPGVVSKAAGLAWHRQMGLRLQRDVAIATLDDLGQPIQRINASVPGLHPASTMNVMYTKNKDLLQRGSAIC